jgi:hypothetical protein
MKIVNQAKSQYADVMAHKAKFIGGGLGLTAGVLFGVSGKKETWMVAGFALAGMVGGAVLGGMFDKPNVLVVGTDSNGEINVATANAGDAEGVSNAIGSVRARQYVMSGNRRRRA